MKYIFFVIFGILLYKMLNNSDKFSISGKNINQFCDDGNDDDCNDGRGTCEDECLCMLNEELNVYVCEKDEPLFENPSPSLSTCAPTLVSNSDRSVSICDEIIQKMEEDMIGRDLLHLRRSNFDKEECRRPLQECIKYTLDYPDRPHIYIARKFYYTIIDLFKNHNINNLTVHGNSDLESIHVLSRTSRNSNPNIDLSSGSTCLSDIDFGESATYYFFCWRTVSVTDRKRREKGQDLKQYIKDNIDEKYWIIIDQIPYDILYTRVLLILNPTTDDDLRNLTLLTTSYAHNPMMMDSFFLKKENQDLQVRISDGKQEIQNQVRVLYKYSSFNSCIFLTNNQIELLNIVDETVFTQLGERIYTEGNKTVIEEGI